MAGVSETDKLKVHLIEQLERLVQQLSDLEEYKDDMTIEEYTETKMQTKEQMQELSNTLSKFQSGDMTLVNDLAAMKMALQAAISDAFKTPEIIRLFGNRQPAQLRLKLADCERDFKIKAIDEAHYKERKAEILTALKKLDDHLTPDEIAFLEKFSTKELAEFEAVTEERGPGEKVLGLLGAKRN